MSNTPHDPVYAAARKYIASLTKKDYFVLSDLLEEFMPAVSRYGADCRKAHHALGSALKKDGYQYSQHMRAYFRDTRTDKSVRMDVTLLAGPVQEFIAAIGNPRFVNVLDVGEYLMKQDIPYRDKNGTVRMAGHTLRHLGYVKNTRNTSCHTYVRP